MGWVDAANDLGNGIKDFGKRVGESLGIIPPKDRAAIEAAMRAGDKARAEDLYARAMARMEAAGNEFGPVQGNIVNKAQVEGVGPAPTLGVHEAGPVRGYSAGTVGTPEDVQLGNVPYGVEAANIGDATLTRRTIVGDAPSLSPEARALRQQQLAAVQDVRSGPSAAAAQLEAALAKSMRNKLGAAARARGVERTGLLRESILSSGEDAVEAGALAAAEAAREEQAKRMNAANLLAGVRSSDVELATTEAQMRQQAQQLQAQIDAAAARGDMEAVNSLKAKQAELTQAARSETSRQAIDVAKTRADVAAGNVTRRTAVETGNVERTTASDQFMAAETNRRASEEAARRATLDVEQARLKLEASKFDAGAKNDAEREYQQALQREADAKRKLEFDTALAKSNAKRDAYAAALDAAGLASGVTERNIGSQREDAKARRESGDRVVNFLSTTGATIAGGPSAGAAANQATKPKPR